MSASSSGPEIASRHSDFRYPAGYHSDAPTTLPSTVYTAAPPADITLAVVNLA